MCNEGRLEWTKTVTSVKNIGQLQLMVMNMFTERVCHILNQALGVPKLIQC